MFLNWEQKQIWIVSRSERKTGFSLDLTLLQDFLPLPLEGTGSPTPSFARGAVGAGLASPYCPQGKRRCPSPQARAPGGQHPSSPRLGLQEDGIPQAPRLRLREDSIPQAPGSGSRRMASLCARCSLFSHSRWAITGPRSPGTQHDQHSASVCSQTAFDKLSSKGPRLLFKCFPGWKCANSHVTHVSSPLHSARLLPGVTVCTVKP